jgi:5-hydroxyisourate hydrolase
MSEITTHVLDTARGEPANGIMVTLQRVDPDGTVTTLGVRRTDADGRARGLLADERLAVARYRLVFDTGAYQREQGGTTFFPTVTIEFDARDAAAHYHVPLLLSPFGYSTYRGN